MTESVRMAWNLWRKYVISVEYNSGFLYTFLESINVAFWYCTNMTLGTSVQKDLYLERMRFIVNSERSKSHFKNESCHSKIAAHI